MRPGSARKPCSPGAGRDAAADPRRSGTNARSRPISLVPSRPARGVGANPVVLLVAAATASGRMQMSAHLVIEPLIRPWTSANTGCDAASTLYSFKSSPHRAEMLSTMPRRHRLEIDHPTCDHWMILPPRVAGRRLNSLSMAMMAQICIGAELGFRNRIFKASDISSPLCCDPRRARQPTLPSIAPSSATPRSARDLGRRKWAHRNSGLMPVAQRRLDAA